MEKMNDFGGFEIADDSLDFFTSVSSSEPKQPTQKADEPTPATDADKKETTEPAVEEVADDGTFLSFGETAAQTETNQQNSPSNKSFKQMTNEEIEDAIEQRAVQMLKEKLSGMPDDVKKLVEFATNGGDSMQYMQKIFTEKSSPITADMDMSDGKNQAMIVAYNLALDGYDQDYIQAQLEFLSQQNKLEEVAQKQFAKWKYENEENERKMLEEQRRSVEEQKIQRRKVKSDLSNFLNISKAIGGVAIDSKDKVELPDYMTSRNVKMDNGSIITPMQRDLYAVLADRDKSIVLAKLLRSGMDLSSIQQQAETKVVRKIKEDMRRTNGLDNVRSSDSGNINIQSIADLF